MTGLAVTDWYSPTGKPDERLRVTAFIKARALRSDSIAVTVERQTRSPAGQWQDAPVAQKSSTSWKTPSWSGRGRSTSPALRVDQQ